MITSFAYNKMSSSALFLLFLFGFSLIYPSINAFSDNSTRKDDSSKAKGKNEIYTDSDEHAIYNSSQKFRNDSRNEEIRRKKYEDFKRKSQQAVRNTIDASKTESCDVKLSFSRLPDPLNFVTNSLKNFKGEMCGSYYKILDVDKSTINDQMDDSARKKLLKKAYRKLSLTVHPDKHGGSSEAHIAFEKIQDAYDCLSDDTCRETYDVKLQSIEQSILQHRLKMREIFLTAVKRTIKVVHYHTSVTAFFIRHMGNQIANFFDRWQVSLMDNTIVLPVGKFFLWSIISQRAKGLFLIYGTAYTIVALNDMLLNLKNTAR